MNWRNLRYRIEYLVFRTGALLPLILSPRSSAAVARGVAFIIHRILPRKWTRYEIARQNIRTAFGDHFTEQQIDVMIYKMWVHLFRLGCEILQLPRKYRRTQLFDLLEIDHHSEMVRALCTDRPMILVSGHFGNWEIGISVFGTFGFPMGVVARELDNPYLNDWFRAFRERTGHQMLAKKGGYDEMLTTLEQGGKLALLGDQDAGPRGLFVDFFGQPASTFKSIALLAIEYDAILFVGTSRRLPDDFERSRWVRYAVDCDAVIDPREIDADDPIREITQRFTTAIENAVRRAPEQYFWLHRRWKSAPGQRRRTKKYRKAG
jgi:Kdo2-lipid IVA lauroyltransferase/acyltransferase